MTREEAIQELNSSPYNKKLIDDEKNFICSKLSISRDELDGFMALEKKTYKDYKNYSFVYKYGSIIMKLMNLEVGGKR